MFFHSKIQTNQQRAFGLIELMVSISIMALVSAIIITRQSAFNGAVLLRNQAYEVAFALREAQLLAVSGGDESVRVYGVYLDTSTANQQTYRIFKDANNNETFDTGEQLGLTGKLDSRFEIRGLMVDSTVLTSMVILFERPNFDAKYYNGSGTVVNGASAYVDVSRLDVAGTGAGDVRRVQVSDTGQISVVTY